MKVAITGHRPNKLGNDYDLTSDLIQKIKNQIVYELHLLCPDDQLNRTFFTLITGMALGIDTLFAKIAIEQQIPFIAAIPCLNHDSKWIEKSRKVYHEILANPLCSIKLVSNTGYNNSVMQKRNEWMVDHCDVLIAVWNRTSGGTANCITYAVKQKKYIIYINPELL